MRRTHAFPAVPQSVHAARRFTTETLVGADGRTLEAVELMVSELATNCIRHEHAGFHVAILSAPNEIRVEVTDGGSGSPRIKSPGPDEPSGRGLQIVNMLSDHWGVEPESPAGKTVWFTLDVAPEWGRSSESALAVQGRGPAAAAAFVARPTVQHWRAPQACNRPRRYCAHEPGRHVRRRCRPADAAG